MKVRCPVCHEELNLEGKTYRCHNRHSFDCAASGYVNLNLKNSAKKNHGDNKMMVQARSAYLQKGYYQKLANALITELKQHSLTTLIDCGCGEGYYTRQISNALTDTEVIGVDLSKDAIDYAAKKDKLGHYFISSLFTIPMFDGDVDCITSLFAPLALDEFYRLLKKEGLLIVVAPGPRHLMQLKEALYHEVYLNEVSTIIDTRFQLVSESICAYLIQLPTQAEIQSLFAMTPYYYKTSLEDKKKLETYSSLETEVEFSIQLYRKQ